MDGRTADPTPNPQSVLRQLIRQAEAEAASSSTPRPNHPQEPLHFDDDNDNDNDDDDDDDDDSTSSSGQSDEDTSSPPAPDDESHQLLPYEQFSATLASIAADRSELTTLLRQRRHLSVAQKRNTSHQQSLERSHTLLLRTRDELRSALNSLDVADILDAEDQSLEVIRTHAIAQDAAATCPFPAAMVRQIPLLRLQSIERAEYDNALGSRMWIEAEDQQLRVAVKAAALKAYTVALSLDSTFQGDALVEAAKMDEMSALRLAEQIECEQQPSPSKVHGRNALKGLDWATISARMPSRTIEELRTRWNRVLRPSINTKPWSNKEVEEVIGLATPHLAAYLAQTQAQAQAQAQPQSSTTASSSTPQTPIPWQRIAQQLNTGRTAYSCFVAFCSAIVQRDQPEMSSCEDDQIKELFSLFRGAWRFMALHITSSPNISQSSLSTSTKSMTSTKTSAGQQRPATLLGKVARDPQTIYRRFRNTTDPALATGMWSLREDLLLIEAVHNVGQDNWTAVAARVPGRTSSQCRERFVRRLKQVVDELGEGQGTGTDPERIVRLLENKKKMTWSQEMDGVLLEYLDGDMKGKEGRTFASIAKLVADKTGLALSDKNVRDRAAILRRNKTGSKNKGSAGREARQGIDDGSSSKKRLMHGDGMSGGAEQHVPALESITQETPSVVQPQPDTSHAGSRTRTAIVPGAKRRRL
ncbi:uncharacterized protein UTRI_04365_B [Ustilago trichophora]|uniref:Uncharacterized protein n=1 Tax=Ustilago trichophora TaxID=86804 RepID=A0A5C3EAG0_9BASI|nr:uncharacterized protein UTRI_04365_B [Ustilago trichophora]